MRVGGEIQCARRFVRNKEQKILDLNPEANMQVLDRVSGFVEDLGKQHNERLGESLKGVEAQNRASVRSSRGSMRNRYSDER